MTDKTTIIPSDLKVTELREALSERNLSTKGLKKELISRLEEALANELTTTSDEKIDVINDSPIESDTLPPRETDSEPNTQEVPEVSNIITDTEKISVEVLSETPADVISDKISLDLNNEENIISENSVKLEENSELVSDAQDNKQLEHSSNIIEEPSAENQTSLITNPLSSVESLSTTVSELKDVSTEINIAQPYSENISESAVSAIDNSFETSQPISESHKISPNCIQNVLTSTDSSSKLLSTLSGLEKKSCEVETTTLSSLCEKTQVDPLTTVVESSLKVETTISVQYTEEKNGSTMEDEAVSFQSSPNLDITINQIPEAVNENHTESQTLQTNSSGELLKFVAITNLTRPFPLGDFEEQLREYGPITQFWIDKFRSHCYVQYENGEGASLCKSMLAGVQFPPDTGKKLGVALLDESEGLTLLQKERSSKQRFTLALEGDKPELQEYSDTKKQLVRGLPSARRSLPQDSVQNEDRKRLHTNLPPQLPLDSLFLKTATKPCLYFKPNKSTSSFTTSKKGISNDDSNGVSKPTRNGSVHSASSAN